MPSTCLKAEDSCFPGCQALLGKDDYSMVPYLPYVFRQKNVVMFLKRLSQIVVVTGIPQRNVCIFEISKRFAVTDLSPWKIFNTPRSALIYFVLENKLTFEKTLHIRKNLTSANFENCRDLLMSKSQSSLRLWPSVLW